VAHGDIESADLAATGTYVLGLAQAGMLEDTPELRYFLHTVAGFPVPSAEELSAARAERASRSATAAAPAEEDEMPEEEPGDGGGPPLDSAPFDSAEAFLRDLRHRLRATLEANGLLDDFDDAVRRARSHAGGKARAARRRAAAGAG
jgi:hypothetical protein